MKIAPELEVATDMNSWSAWVDRTGVAVSVLIVLAVLAWRFARWLRPKADTAIDIFIDANKRMPAIIVAQGERDRMLQSTLERQNELISKSIDQNERVLEELARTRR